MEYENLIDKMSDKILYNIFNTVQDFSNLDIFEKRKMVFDYLVNNCEYDFKLLNDIYLNRERDVQKEIISVLNCCEENNIGFGVCNSFVCVYKMLLDKLHIPSILLKCKFETYDVGFLERQNIDYSRLKKTSDGKFIINHMFNMIQNPNGTFSFDDITFAIFNKQKDKMHDYFNYDYKTTEEKGQMDIIGVSEVFLRYNIGGSKTKFDVAYEDKFKIGKGIELCIPQYLISSYNIQNFTIKK